jgi:tetratricopeptide (TPR) repeat protein
MKNADKLRLIEAFYRGTLTGEDKSNFSKLMNDDLSFKHEVQDYKSIFIGFEALHVEAFQKNLMSFEAKHSAQENQSTEVLPQQPKSVVIRSLRKFYYAAAAIALLICATFGYNQWATSTFDEYFQTSQSIADEALATVRGANEVFSEAQKVKKSALSAYWKGNYSRAIVLLEGYVNEYNEIASNDYQSILVLGVSQLAENKTEKALVNLSLAAKSPDSSYKQEAEWYYALALIKTEAEAEAITILKQLVKRKAHIHNKDAIMLLDDM